MRSRDFLTGLAAWKRSAKGKSEQSISIKDLDPDRLPNHVAIIMDGNGRWAKNRGLPRGSGHRAGIESLRDVVRVCTEIGIQVLTVFAFSTENWRRPQEEVNILMSLLIEYLRKEVPELQDKGIQVRAIGRLNELPPEARRELEQAISATSSNQRMVLNLALNYGGRAEIVDATKKIVDQAQKGLVEPEAINEQMFGQYLYTAGLPDPDLLIRPSGELRVSNFLLWQAAYAEFWTTGLLWPDFRKDHLIQALFDYQQRDRRFGGVKGGQ